AEHLLEHGLAVVPRHAGAVRPVAEIRKIQLEAAARLQMHHRPNFVDELGPAVRGEAHDLELVAEFREAEVLRDGEIEQAERVREMRAMRHLEVRAATDSP